MMRENIPNGWVLSTLGEVCTQPQYGYTTSGVDVGTLKLLRTTDITSGAIDWNTVPFCSENPVDENKYLLKDGDLVISRAGSIGVSYLLKNPEKSVFASYLIRFRPLINNQFFKYFLDSPYYWQQISENKLGIAIPNVNASKLQSISLLLPPLNEQKRIVAKIEALFSELDNGIKSLKTAREQLKVYRQAILKNAFEGKFTSKWRRINKDELETADQLLERIKQEREAYYQQLIIDWEAAVKAGKKVNKPKAHQPITILSTEELEKLPKLPNGWLWVRYGNLCSIVRNGISQKPEGNEGTKIFRISAVRPMEFIINDIRYIDNSNGQYDEYFLQKGDLVFTRYNGSRHYVGVCAEYKLNGNHLFPDKLIQTRVAIPSIINGYLEKAINCGATRKFIERLIRTTAGQSGISGSDIKAMPVPICSNAEQEIINNYISEELSRIAKIENEIEINLQKAEALRQSILKKAFSGSLVAQDANDEPVNALLERIRTEKKFYLADNKTKHQKDVNSDNEYVQDYLIEEASV